MLSALEGSRHPIPIVNFPMHLRETLNRTPAKASQRGDYSLQFLGRGANPPANGHRISHEE